MREDLIEIENQISQKRLELNNNNFYIFANLYEKEITMIFNNLKEFQHELDKIIEKPLFILEKFNLNFNATIKNPKEYIILILSIFTIKALVPSNSMDILEIGDEYNENKTLMMFESDKIINMIVKDVTSFLIWLEIFYNLNTIFKIKIEIKKKEIRLQIYKSLVILKTNSVIRFEKRWIKGKSMIFIDFNVILKNFIFLSLFNEPFKIYKRPDNEIFLYIDHFSNIYKLFKENIFSGSKIVINTESIFFKNLLEIKVKIDYNLLKYFFNLKLKKNNYKEEDLYNNYRTLMEEIKKSIKTSDKTSLSHFSRKISELNDLIRIYEILNLYEIREFYFPPFLCFRGRTYFLSSISFTFHKEFRFCLYTSNYEEDFSLPFHPLNRRIKEVLNTQTSKLEMIEKYNFKNKDENTKHSILWIVISFAEMRKEKIGSKISIGEFVDYGIDIINKKNILIFSDEYEEFKFYSLENMLKEIDKDIYIKRLISKDATASCFQHLIKILGNESKDSLIWCNLSSEDTWYDIYIYILNTWKKNILNKLTEKEIEIIEYYFVRKTIKRVIMTNQYGASLSTCWRYFQENNKKIEENDKIFLENTFKNFFEFISSNVGILNKNPLEIIKSLEKINFIIKMRDKTIIDLNYYKTKKKQIKFTYNSKRYTKQQEERLEDTNSKKIGTSSRANYIHIHDSAVIRYVISIKPILTIHDCFLIDYKSTTFLLSIVNEAMQKTFHDLKLNQKFKADEVFSIFIVI